MAYFPCLNLNYKLSYMLLDDVRFVPTVELQSRVQELEQKYAEALGNESDIHTLSKIWQRIKEIKSELSTR